MLPWAKQKMRDALRMAAAYSSDHRMRVLWQERAADHRECLVDAAMKRRGATLAEIVAEWSRRKGRPIE